jgi:hypothetical protein
MNKLLATLAGASALLAAQPALAVTVTNVGVSAGNTANVFLVDNAQISIDFGFVSNAPTTIDFSVDAGDATSYFFDSAINMFAGSGVHYITMTLTDGATFDLGSVLGAFSTATAQLNGAGNVATITFSPVEYVAGEFGSLVGTPGDFVIHGNGLSTADTFSLIVSAGPIPEPASWAMMIAGFGLIGGAMRRRQGALAAA